MRAVRLVVAATVVAFAWGGVALGRESPPVAEKPEKAGQDQDDKEPPKTELTEADREKLAAAREALAVAVDAREAGDVDPSRVWWSSEFRGPSSRGLNVA